MFMQEERIMSTKSVNKDIKAVYKEAKYHRSTADSTEVLSSLLARVNFWTRIEGSRSII